MTLKQGNRIIPVKLRFALKACHDNFPKTIKEPGHSLGSR